jgi:DNA repair exonuclease SbcCD ATPase subunit
MRVRFWINVSMIVAALCVTGLLAAAQQQGSSEQQTGDPVADAARKAREKKKDAPKPKKIYTDDDVKKSAPEPAPAAAPGVASGTVAATAVPAAGDSAKTGDATKTEDPNGQAAWRRRFQDQRDKIAKIIKELEILGRELEKAQLEYYPDPQKAMTQQNSRADINDKLAKIDAKKKELDQLRQGLDDLEDQLRKSGGDPGWAR